MNTDNYWTVLTINKVRQDLHHAVAGCQVRGLVHGTSWLSELLLSTYNGSVSEQDGSVNSASLISQNFDGLNFEEITRFMLAKSYFDTQEYRRCTHVLASARQSHRLIDFLTFYARYMAGEKRRTDESITEKVIPSGDGTVLPHDDTYNRDLYYLKSDMEKRFVIEDKAPENFVTAFLASSADIYVTYVYALICLRLGFKSAAIGIFTRIVKREPTFWPAWSEMIALLDDREQLDRLFPTPGASSLEWMPEFFRAKAYIRLHESERALVILERLRAWGFQKSLNLQADIAEAYDRLRDLESAMINYKQLFAADPYRLTETDLYSNLLFVKGEHTELAYLARWCAAVDKYSPQTCCALGNFYGLRSQHDKAVQYFQRALRLHPRYALVWTLIGHEFVELQLLKSAIYAYNQAIVHNPHDHRAWYGLGQLHEFVKQPDHALYYYKRAQYLCPSDSRMIVAMGEVYEKLGLFQAAKKCFWRGYCVGDMEGGALVALARCFDRAGEVSEAAAAHTQFIKHCEHNGVTNELALGNAYRYLANYHLQRGHHEDAVIAANKCLDFPELREEAKALCLQLTLLAGCMTKKTATDGGEEDSAADRTVEPGPSRAACDVPNEGTGGSSALCGLDQARRLRLHARRRLLFCERSPRVDELSIHEEISEGLSDESTDYD